MGSRSPRLWLVVLAFVAFVSLGLPDTVLGVAWPSIRATFQRPFGQLGVLLIAGSAGYLTSSFFGGQIMRRFGVGKLLFGSSVLVTVALVGAAFAPAWEWMVASAALGGLGAGAIDAGINTFAGSCFSPRVVNWLHAFWGVGATTGPLLMTAVLAHGLAWRVGYGILSAMLAALSVVFLLTMHLWRIGTPASPSPAGDRANPGSPGSPGSPEPTATIGEALRQPVVLMQVVLFFVYTGLESAAGQLLYTLFTEYRGVAVTTAGITIGAYWGALTAGRLIFGQLAATFHRRTILRVGLGLAPTAAALIWWAPASGLDLAGTVLLGFALAPVFPTLISLTPEHVGAYHAPQAVGFQVAAATAGIMVFPGAGAVLVRHFGPHAIGACLLLAALALLVLHELSIPLGKAARPRYDEAGRFARIGSHQS